MSHPASAFPLQLAFSSLVVGGVVAGLAWLGRTTPESSRTVTSSATVPLAPEARPVAQPPATSPSDRVSARGLLPAGAWLVADFEGALLGDAPFQGQLEGPCERVHAPERVGLALLPEARQSDGLAVVLAVPNVTGDFWNCARQKVLAAGGEEAGSARGYEVLKSPSGILLRTPGPHLVFMTHESLLEPLIAIRRGVLPSAEQDPPHARQTVSANKLVQAFGSGAQTDSSISSLPLVVTVALPPDWLSGAGPEADASPLRHLTGGVLLAQADGRAEAALSCQNPGCEGLATFLLRAKTDLTAQLPAHASRELNTSLSAKLLPRTPGEPENEAHLGLSWSSPDLPLPRLAAQIYDLFAPDESPAGKGPGQPESHKRESPSAPPGN